MMVSQLAETYDKPALRNLDPQDWTRKEVAAVIQMTTEFLKDMDMKLRDVKRVESYYYFSLDFGAGRIFATINSKFEHMCLLYKNASAISRVMGEWGSVLRENLVGSLQFVLSDYMEMLSLIDMFKERYSYWRANSDRIRMRNIIKEFLLKHDVKPENYEEAEDQWRRSAGRRLVSAHPHYSPVAGANHTTGQY